MTLQACRLWSYCPSGQKRYSGPVGLDRKMPRTKDWAGNGLPATWKVSQFKSFLRLFDQPLPGNLADWPAGRRVFARSVPVTSKTSDALEHLWRNLRSA